jgi:eukaryotic-like serine/threonine-protein kinase
VPDDAGYVDVFDSRTLTRVGRIPVSPGTQVAAVALSPDGRTVAATTADGHLRFADLRDSQWLGPPQTVADGPAWSLAFSGDGRWLATVGDFGSSLPPLQLWDVRRRALVDTSLLSPGPSDAAAVTFSPDGQQARGGRKRRQRHHGTRDLLRASGTAPSPARAPATARAQWHCMGSA